MTNQTTGKVNPLITNGYFYCGKLDIAFEVSNNQSLNNSKLKVEVFGGELAGVNGFGVDTYVISNNAINQTNNEQNNNLSALIFKSSICGGAGLETIMIYIVYQYLDVQMGQMMFIYM